MKVKLFSCLLILFLGLQLKAQNYSIKSFNEVDSFLNNTNDTLYIINFWATWCKPCIEELPNFEKVNALSSERNVKVILVSLDSETNRKRSLEPFLERNKLTSEIWVMPDKKPIDWIDKINPTWQGSIPATYFFNNVKDIHVFNEHPFTYEELMTKINSF
ncbi:MAG: TlpA family protein disulfide reductase [Chitinophagales bacterium]|jgi:thiol-disulfide isomerase/thioredoxin|nr:TlpA family protein disulfide reductase [Bacteroidota bacterium]MBK7568518.1 TlpA family protein disulfide reductase [Bacteroidota bacterium]MBP8915339.1 TlpA family protein disulfide reductase [Chitinophagales bacterium]MBP9220556.1 TlpA family protein disulfide reductase [Chitinophagales bacterium]MBP9794826.1 TlpA family protein disulfide reductase [Chitinophagales bacterium]